MTALKAAWDLPAFYLFIPPGAELEAEGNLAPGRTIAEIGCCARGATLSRYMEEELRRVHPGLTSR